MQKIIKVIVDLPLRKLDKEFDYLIPTELETEFKIGQIVKVPFGRRKIAAYITAVDVKSELDKSKLKEIDSLLYNHSFFDQEMLSLFRWTAAYYHAYLAQVIKTALPAGITEKIKKEKVDFLKINKKVDDIELHLNKLEKKAPKQFLIFKYLMENRDKKNKLKDVLDYAKTSRQTVYRLIDKALILLYTDIKERNFELKNNLNSNINFNSDNKLTIKEKKVLKELEQDDCNKILLETERNNNRYELITKILKNNLSQQKNMILLVPEIEKEINYLNYLKQEFKNKIAFYFSKMNNGERFDQWQKIQRGDVKIVVGARSAVFAPFSKIDLIMVLEENNENYKQQEHPLYHARQIAAKRIKNNKGKLILESPFPSLESKYLAENGLYKTISFKVEEDKIRTEVVDLKKEIQKGNLSDLSEALKNELKKELSKNNKSILFLNKRGTANYVICRKCAHVIKCKNCDISLNYHQQSKNLKCHYCGFQKKLPDKCPDCGSGFIAKSGIGTDNLLSQLKSEFPQAVIERVDSDLKNKKIPEILNSFNKGEIDILIGTSLIIRENFYQNLNLLAVISADDAINSSDFRSAEKNYVLLKELKSLLTNSRKSRFIIQSYESEHYSIKALKNKNINFYNKEKKLRKKRNYPPYCRLLNIMIIGKNEDKVKKMSLDISSYLNDFKNKYLEKLGAAPAVLNKIRNKFRWQIILKFNSLKNREYIIQIIEKEFKIEENKLNQIRIDVDPYQML